MENKVLKAGIAIGSAVALGISFLGGALTIDPVETVIEKNVTVFEQVEVPVEVPVEVITEIEVDNENLDLVLEHIYDNEGQIEYLIDDLEDDELDEIVDRVVFINDVKALALAEVKSDGIDELHKETVNVTKIYEDDEERFRLYDDDEDVMIADVDFEDRDAEVLVKVRFELDDSDVKYGAEYKVSFEDGVVEDLDLENIYVRE
jgi:hypothetical protein